MIAETMGLNMNKADKTELDNDTEAEQAEVELENEEELEDEHSEVSIQLGDEESPASEDESEEQAAPEWVKNLRKEHRELRKENRELKAKVAPLETVKPTLPARPKLSDDGIDYDEDKYQQATDSWFQAKSKVDADEQAAQERGKSEKAKQEKVQESYRSAAKSLKVKDYEAAEDEVLDALNQMQQGLLMITPDTPEKSAQLVYALGKNPKKLQELAAIKDPVKFTKAVAKLEESVKVVSKRAKPEPETLVTGSPARSSGTAQLDRLRNEAEKTGDYSKVVSYKQKLKAEQRK